MRQLFSAHGAPCPSLVSHRRQPQRQSPLRLGLRTQLLSTQARQVRSPSSADASDASGMQPLHADRCTPVASAHGGSSVSTKSTLKNSKRSLPDARKRKPCRPKPLPTPPPRSHRPRATRSPCVSCLMHSSFASSGPLTPTLSVSSPETLRQTLSG